ncbi:hypothetical protein [Vibrio furnissii]|uniref:hypothetical protein n=1 Tax=Vibrio furnissii TaxID=29494 RepID=UPI0013022BC8|nr:hypothetical protein [Vibrio furnissii]MCG6217226.1 hypothetical protein [Vibrio furnissii]
MLWVEEAIETIKMRDNAGADFTTIYGVNHPILGAESSGADTMRQKAKQRSAEMLRFQVGFTL